MYSQSTYKEPLFCSSWFALCSSAERQLVWELVMGFSIVFKRQRTTHMLTSRDTTVISHWKSHSKGHRLRSDTWLQWLPLQGHYQAVAPDRTDVKGNAVSQKGAASPPTPSKGTDSEVREGTCSVTGPVRDQPLHTQPRAVSTPYSVPLEGILPIVKEPAD